MSIEAMWHDYHGGLFAYVLKHLRDYDTANDLLSAIYLRAMVAIRNGNGPVTNEYGWLYAIARSALNDHWRAKKYTRFVEWDALPARETVDEDADLDATVTRQMEAERLRYAVARLPGTQAEVVTWRLQGYDYEEIAAGLERSYGATKGVMTRAYANLREQLQEGKLNGDGAKVSPAG